MKLTKQSRVLMLSHLYVRSESGGGPPQEVRDYLLPRVKSLTYIEHPFPYAKDHRSSMTVYVHGKRSQQYFTPNFHIPEVGYYILDIFITLYFLLKDNRSYDCCIALDSLNVVSVLMYKFLGKVDKLVFYSIDYTPYRFHSRFINFFYHFFDKIACYYSDAIWVLSSRMMDARLQMGTKKNRIAHIILLPMGANLKRIKIFPFSKINRYTLVFVGHLLEKQGLQLVLEALADVRKKVPQVKFLIIGQGAYENDLRQKIHKLKLAKIVEVKGFVKDHTDVEKILCACGIGISLYKPDRYNYTYYTDPGKPKLYLACGLPVIISDVPESADIIDRNKAGLKIQYDKKEVIKALLTMLTNEKRYKMMRAKAIRLAKQFDTDTLIKKAIQQT